MRESSKTGKIRLFINKWVVLTKSYLPCDYTTMSEIFQNENTTSANAGKGGMANVRSELGGVRGKEYRTKDAKRPMGTYSLNSTNENLKPWEMLHRYLIMSDFIEEATPSPNFLVQSCQFDDINSFDKYLTITARKQGYDVFRVKNGGIKAKRKKIGNGIVKSDKNHYDMDTAPTELINYTELAKLRSDNENLKELLTEIKSSWPGVSNSFSILYGLISKIS